jgi:hypothetical protein
MHRFLVVAPLLQTHPQATASQIDRTQKTSPGGPQDAKAFSHYIIYCRVGPECGGRADYRREHRIVPRHTDGNSVYSKSGQHARDKQPTGTSRYAVDDLTLADGKSVCNFTFTDNQSICNLSVANGKPFNHLARSDNLAESDWNNQQPVSTGNLAQQHRDVNFTGQQHGKPIEFVDQLFEFDESLKQQFGHARHNNFTRHNNQFNQSVIEHNRNALCSYWEFAEQHFAQHDLPWNDDIAEHHDSTQFHNISKHHNTGDASSGNRFSVNSNDNNSATKYDNFANHNLPKRDLSKAAPWVKDEAPILRGEREGWGNRSNARAAC